MTETNDGPEHAEPMDRTKLIRLVQMMIEGGRSATDIVDIVIGKLTPADDEECPVCGLCP